MVTIYSPMRMDSLVN